MVSLQNFEVNFWTNVEPSLLFNKTPPESFKNINFKNIETLDSYLPFKNFFESNAPYL